MSDKNFLDWVVPPVTEKAEKAEAPKPAHIQLGEQLGEKFPGFKATKDLYGNGAEPHGSPWVIEGDKTADIGQYLRMQGYRPAKKNAWKRGPLLVEMGVYSGKTRVYITDDN